MLRALEEVEPALKARQVELAALFGVRVEPQVLILEDFDRIRQPSWVVGFCIPRKQLIVVKEQSACGRSREEWLKVIVHEMVHLFYLEAFGNAEPMWFYEGLACYLAGQQKAAADVTLKELLQYHNKTDERTYRLGYSAVRKLMGG